MRLPLGHFPTPVFRWRVPGLPASTELYIKRDDFSGAETSGNKIRKLEFLLAKAIAVESDTVITCGGVQSNHCRATAAAAAWLNLQCHIILRVPDADIDKDPGFEGNLLVERMVGATVHLVSQSEYSAVGSDMLIAQLHQKLELAGRRPYSIPVGGSNGLGTFGYVEAVAEMQEQSAHLGITDVAFACGSGGTAAGVGLGVKLSGWGVKAHAFTVCDDEAYFVDYIDRLILPSMLSSTRSPSEQQLGAAEMLSFTQAVGDGYAVSTAEELQFVQEVARATGVVLDPVYAGKAAFRLCRQLKEEPAAFHGKKILFINTGGLLGLYAKGSMIAPHLSPCERLVPDGKGGATKARL
jgi:D-cysteine desulfhydrase family pyridoxal phosphate-dependent enzyme